MPSINEVTILLVEDDEGHARLVEKNLRRSDISNPIVKCQNGQLALNYLFGEQGYVNTPHHPPLLILLDLNLPVVDGYGVLEAVKRDARTKRIPIIILTTTDDEREMERCYELGCNVYVTKPIAYEKFAEAIHSLGLFLSVVTLPDGG